MRISNTPLKTRISKFVQNIKYERKQKFLDKYCRISDDIEGDAYIKLDSARETIANYAKSKGVTVKIGDAEKEVAKENFEFDIDEKYTKRMTKNKLKVTVSPLKELSKSKGVRLLSSSEYISKNTSKNDFYASEEIDSSNKAFSITNKIEYNFLQNIYRVIENQIKALQ